MAVRKEETVTRLTECIKVQSNEIARCKTEMEAAFREYDEENMDLSKLDRLKDAITDLIKILQSTNEVADRHCILQLRRPRPGRENMDVRSDSGILSGGKSFIAQESEEPIDPVRRYAMLMSIVPEDQMQEQDTESDVSSTNQTIIDDLVHGKSPG